MFSNQGQAEIQKWYAAFKDLKITDQNKNFNTELIETLEFQNLMQLAVHVVACAGNRKESRGEYQHHDKAENPKWGMQHTIKSKYKLL